MNDQATSQSDCKFHLCQLITASGFLQFPKIYGTIPFTITHEILNTIVFEEKIQTKKKKTTQPNARNIIENMNLSKPKTAMRAYHDKHLVRPSEANIYKPIKHKHCLTLQDLLI